MPVSAGNSYVNFPVYRNIVHRGKIENITMYSGCSIAVFNRGDDLMPDVAAAAAEITIEASPTPDEADFRAIASFVIQPEQRFVENVQAADNYFRLAMTVAQEPPPPSWRCFLDVTSQFDNNTVEVGLQKFVTDFKEVQSSNNTLGQPQVLSPVIDMLNHTSFTVIVDTSQVNTASRVEMPGISLEASDLPDFPAQQAPNPDRIAVIRRVQPEPDEPQLFHVDRATFRYYRIRASRISNYGDFRLTFAISQR